MPMQSVDVLHKLNGQKIAKFEQLEYIRTFSRGDCRLHCFADVMSKADRQTLIDQLF